MQYTIAHSLSGRVRIRCGKYAFTELEALAIAELLKKKDGVVQAIVSATTGSILINYENVQEQQVISYISELKKEELDTSKTYAIENNSGERFFIELSKKFAARYICKIFLPLPIRKVVTFIKAFGYIRKALDYIVTYKKIGVEVLDAAAITSSLVQGSFETANSVMFLLSVSEIIEEWTRKKSRSDLAESLVINVDTAWLYVEDKEILTPMSNIEIDDVIVVRSGYMIPVDGEVVFGEAMVNQSMMTGEPLAIKRSIGNTVFAGTVVEEGSIGIKVTALKNDTRIQNIIHLIDESEQYKSEIQSKNERIADSIVPFSFLGALTIYAITRNFAKATSILMVDYSCALKLSSSLAVLSALQESVRHKVLVKGGRFLEVFAEADTIVFDKTGTLTVASPTVKDIISFGKYDKSEVLKISACLEEHFPHSVARAVVKKAEQENIYHDEEHSTVEYIVAHGIASKLGDKRVIIGSEHFIFEDEGIKRETEKIDIIHKTATTESILYLAIDGELAGAVLIEDPIRESAKETINNLYKVGFKNIVMLTGDAEKTAKSVADQIGIKTYKARMLPEDKADYINSLKASGKKVVMIGDGVNDTPALSVADVGISMKDSSDIAREISDISLLSSDLGELIYLRKISEGLLSKSKKNYNFTIGFNTILLGAGLIQLITPSQSALLHNMSTVATGVYSLQPVIK